MVLTITTADAPGAPAPWEWRSDYEVVPQVGDRLLVSVECACSEAHDFTVTERIFAIADAPGGPVEYVMLAAEVIVAGVLGKPWCGEREANQ